MIQTKRFGDELKNLNFNQYIGVPCSFLKSLINYAMNECEYIAATNEGDAVAIASGVSVGGEKPVVLMQNSGLTNAVSPLTSLVYPFQIPILGFVSLRGEEGIRDEPQHELMGQITMKMLDLMEVEWQYLSTEIEKALEQIKVANNHIEDKRSFFFIVKKGTFSDEKLIKETLSTNVNQNIVEKKWTNQLPTRFEALKVINEMKDSHTIQLATTGKTGRELYEIEDADNNLYMVGSMGCISSFGLGLAISQLNQNIVVIDGDGSLLMRLGSMATIGYYQPSNMLHILLDNHTYDSTGGQSTVSQNIDFNNIAASCGYANSLFIHNLSELQAAIIHWKKEKSLTFLHLKISKGSKQKLGRPTIKPFEVHERLKRFINEGSE
ncbi:phosphonopyruvate decarboxylase [Chengkuizengella axinellae]|uniref:Phosphonopyruvate decarboxylase n=1 Tax=Chengkuizengella axinellae TaxID=3064388 RepID=A0ABT9J1G5_9BACL|nr:phosphonopyruvate decarboxylase [Chengkuizengella sp. 2205SS18-9]MDP5275455.1 phosphonopyruvate decarboxylase [Chengkuizengella sp. 2205SS18-9]